MNFLKDRPNSMTSQLNNPVSEWRSQLLDFVLKVVSIVGGAMVLMSIKLNYDHAQYTVILFEVLGFTALVTAATTRAFSFNVKCFFLLATFYLIGLSLFLAYGFYSGVSMMVLLGYSIMTSLILGRKAGYLSLIHLFFTILVIALMDINHMMKWSQQLNQSTLSSSVRYINCFAFIALLTIAVSRMVRKLQNSLVEIHDARSDLEKRNAELVKKNEQLDQFLYRAAHDMRSPLSSILGLVNITRHDVQEPNKVNENLIRVESSVKRLDDYLKDLVNFSKNAQNKLFTEKIYFDKLLITNLKEFKGFPGFASIEFETSIEPDLEFVHDSVRLNIILSNLISNAIKYRDKSKKESKIKIEAAIADQQLVLMIKDNGLGIEQENLNKIFTLFYRGHEESDGSGIGLHIVQECVTKMGGQITVESEKAKGTQFTISIPLLEKEEYAIVAE